MKTENIDIPSPCEGAVQVGSTSDLRAVWQKGDKTFMVFHDAQSRMHTVDVRTTVIARKCDPPIPWDSLQNDEVEQGLTDDFRYKLEQQTQQLS